MNDIMTKLGQNEKMVGAGAIIVIVGGIIGIMSFSFGGFFGMAAAVATLVILFLKYQPNSQINWPVPVPLITLILGAIVLLGGLLSALSFLAWLGLWGWLIGASLFGWLLSVAAVIIGGALMTYGSYLDYQKIGKS